MIVVFFVIGLCKKCVDYRDMDVRRAGSSDAIFATPDLTWIVISGAAHDISRMCRLDVASTRSRTIATLPEAEYQHSKSASSFQDTLYQQPLPHRTPVG